MLVSPIRSSAKGIMDRHSHRPPKRSQRREALYIQKERLISLEERRLALSRELMVSKEKSFEDLRERLSENKAALSRNLALAQAMADMDGKMAATLWAWLLSSALASNIAGVWILMGAIKIDPDSAFWSLIWFSAGAATSFLAGIYLFYWSKKNFNALFGLVIKSSSRSTADDRDEHTQDESTQKISAKAENHRKFVYHLFTQPLVRS